ncbi:DNA helicase, UvrD-like, C-terminal [Kalmanozyma brasiliensis GHG001]|uniref:DNA helicase, UvrD-like, C-terminal n=1 Tax=Kalmanozyma brasiliensis (strain GHG001) TaxID=1365824 RepID=UPI001CEB0198|nr:DNA helicase, UvrD-like, C-terminal [Kalmanozyma brasiliensis GHG001]EST07991.2 DNA helicase, UvrD-like, C-terminal [Kalmanozyma brasiliensis GHG001]
MQPLSHLNPLLDAKSLNILPFKRPGIDKCVSANMPSPSVPSKRRTPPSSSTFAQPQASTSTAAGPSSSRSASASTSVATASNRPLKKKVASSNDDSVAARLQPKLSQSSWRRTKSYQHVDLSGPTRRTVLEWLPREVVFMVLHLLSFRDIQSLLRADKRIRPLIHAKTFCPWRKLLASFLHCERLYDETIALEEESMFDGNDNDSNHGDDDAETTRDAAQADARPNGGNAAQATNANQVQIEQNFIQAYKDLVGCLQLKAAPIDLLELVPCLTRLWHDHVSFPLIRKWCRDFVVGRVTADHLFADVDHVIAVEVLCSVRLYLAVVRISRAFSQNTPPIQSVRVLDYDCRTAINTFFQPDRILPAPGSTLTFQLTHEQDRFVRRDVRPGELVKVQAFAGTGKTRSLLAYAERRPNKRFLYIAFNKAAAEEARRRFPDHVQCRTMHSVALCQVVRTAGQEIGDLRARDVVQLLGESLPEGQLIRAQAMATQTGRDHRLTPTAVATYVLATLQRFFYSDDATIIPDRHVPSKVATDTDLKIRAVARCAQELWDFIREGSPDRNGKSVKCPHDAYVKLLQLQAPHHSENFFRAFDVLLLDEAQDLSAAQVSILLRAKKHCGILIVGDVFQKIYGFRGGTAKAFNERLYPSSAHFQLTKSFRFGDAVAKIATEMLGLRKPAPWERAAAKPVLTGALGMADRVYAEANVFRYQLEPPPSMEPTPPTQQQEGRPNGISTDAEASQGANSTNGAATLAGELQDQMGEGRQAVAQQVGSVGRIGRSDEIIRHTRIFRTNRKLCLTALALSASLPQPHKIFLKTSQSLQPDAVVTLLRDAHILYHNDSRSMSRNSLLRDFASWKDLVQRVEAEGGGESKLSLAVALGGLLASSDFLDQVSTLETRFADTEEEATVILTTVHQAKGLEWDCVYVEDDFRPVFGSDRTQRVEVSSYWHQDELNHLYVALTRAKRQLVVSKVVLQWIAAMRGLYRYRLLTSNSNTSLGKTGLCPHCKASKHPLVVKEYRLACFDFLNPRCNERANLSQNGQPHTENAAASASATKATSSATSKDAPPLTQVIGCTGCLSDPTSAVHMDSLVDPDLALFVATAPKITRQRPHGPKQPDGDTTTSEKSKPTAMAPPAAFKMDVAKHAFLKADHRSMKWAIMHHEYKRAVNSWFNDE